VTPVDERVQLAIGIPQGLFIDAATHSGAGAIRRAGELVSVEPAAYALWNLLLVPTTVDTARATLAQRGLDGVDAHRAQLESLGLVVSLEPDPANAESLAQLRPLPLAAGIGNRGLTGGRFGLQNPTLSLPEPVTLDLLSTMLWWEFDGTASIDQALARVMRQVPTLTTSAGCAVAKALIIGLMGSRLLYLDATTR
jgi:hypothetical protein